MERRRICFGATWNHKQSNATIRAWPIGKRNATRTRTQTRTPTLSHGQKGSPTSSMAMTIKYKNPTWYRTKHNTQHNTTASFWGLSDWGLLAWFRQRQWPVMLCSWPKAASAPIVFLSIYVCVCVYFRVWVCTCFWPTTPVIMGQQVDFGQHFKHANNLSAQFA